MIISVNHNEQVIHRPQKMDLQEKRSVFSFVLSDQQTWSKQPCGDTTVQLVLFNDAFDFYTWKSLSVVIGKYMRPRSLLMCTSTPIFSLTSSAAVCSNPVGTVAPTVTVMMWAVLASFSVGMGSIVSGTGSAAGSSREDMLYSRSKQTYEWTCYTYRQTSDSHITSKDRPTISRCHMLPQRDEIMALATLELYYTNIQLKFHAYKRNQKCLLLLAFSG